MNKKIKFCYGGVNYTLEYDRKAIEIMEANGLEIDAIKSKPASTISILWQGAFLKNHKKEKSEKIQEIYDNMGNKSELNAYLSEMAVETYTSLLGDDEDRDNSKNIDWKMS